METYTIRLPEFEGPFDLLLFFIERDELDIYNIPIAKITEDFLRYLHALEAVDIEIAAEFIFVASSLLRIKAKMMLPRFRSEYLNPEEDPRRELVQQLIEYRKYKALLPEFREREQENMLQIKRGNLMQELAEVSKQISGDVELESLTLYKLLNTFERVMERFDEEKIEILHPVFKYPYTAEESKSELLSLVSEESKMSAQKIFAKCKDRLQAIFIFLALLELIQTGLVLLINGVGTNNFYLAINPNPETVITGENSAPKKELE